MVTAHRLENQEALLRKINAGELKSLYLDVANPVIKSAMQKKKCREETSENLAPEDLHARADVRLVMVQGYHALYRAYDSDCIDSSA